MPRGFFIGLLDVILKGNISEAREHATAALDVFDSMTKSAKWDITKLNNFSIHNDKIIFYYDFDFPGVIRSVQPNKNCEVDFREINDFLKIIL